MKNKIWSIILIICMLMAGFGNMTISAATSEIKVIVDGEQITFDQPPIIEKNRTLVPMRAIFEALGYDVTWDGYLRIAKATLTSGNVTKSAVVHLDFLTMSVSDITNDPADKSGGQGSRREIRFMVPLDPDDSPMKVVNGRTLLPIRAISEALGCAVGWDGVTKTVTINTKDAKITPPKGWVAAIEAHCAKYAPGQLAAKQSWIDDDKMNQMALAMDLQGAGGVQAVETPVSTAEKTYSVFDSVWNKLFEYQYTNPEMPKTPPLVGSTPAKILLDVNKSKALFIPIEGKPYEAIQNVTIPYATGSYGGCNWYATGRFWEVYGIPMPHFDKFFETHEYINAAMQYEEFTVITDVRDIRPMSVVVFGKGADGRGHVAFIEYVEYDASGNPRYVYVTEANVGASANNNYDCGIDCVVRRFSMEEFLGRPKPILGYIIPNPDFYN